ncbi:MAG: VanZ family protein [Chlorobiaceae bacterium]|nr:VanZ family protein [Chlorobiaceae bacterium]NTV61650.1 VanZ family protein [Chlorobiaceae bacterium]
MKKETLLLAVEGRLGLLLSVLYINIRTITPGNCYYGFTWHDKFEHFFAFAVLALLLDFSFPRSSFNLLKVAVLVLYGAGIEVVQLFVAFRDCDPFDFTADLLGITLYFFSIPFLKLVPVIKSRWEE